MRNNGLTRAFSLALAAGLAAGPAAPAATQEPPVFGVEASAVVVDVVVRDKKGRLVRDLTEADFEIYEDNVKQTVASFRIVDTGPAEEEAPQTAAPASATAAAGAAPAKPAVPAAPPKPKPKGAPTVIAFVFDRMGVDARKQAEKAALTYTDHGHVPGDLAAVFSIDLALRTLQAFTNDVDAVRVGIQRAATQGNTAFASDRAEAREKTDATIRAAQTLGSLGAGGGQGAAGAATALQASLTAVQQTADQIQVDMLRTFDALERDQQGHATTNGLIAVVNGLKPIPGRKTVVFFSEGIAITSNVQAEFRSVIASANRANVSVYAIDAAGLRVESGTKEARDEIVLAARRRADQEATGREARGGAMSRNLERNEDLLRLNPETGLSQLAEETGGFLVRDTNDASKGFGRIQEDMRFYYLVSYSPTNESYDGRYRKIAVKVKRPGTEVQTRKGYFAVRPEYIAPVRGYEAPALAQLDRNPKPDAFPIRMAALSFPEAARPGLAPVLVEIPGTAVAWTPEGPAGFHADFAVVVRIRDEKGREADRLSQQYNLTAPPDKLDAARAGKILFYREATVPPGRYTADVVAYDSLAQTASVRSASLDVPKADDGRLRLSTLMLVNRAEKLTPAEQQEGKNPLHFGEVILYPSMGLPFRKSAMPALGFYFSVYGKNAAAVRQATIEVQQGSRVLAKTNSELPPPDAGGRIQHAGALPLKGFAPGEYTLKVSVSDGESSQSRDAAFTVVE